MNIADTRTSSACEQNLLVLICPFLYTLLRPIHVLLVICDTAGSSRIYSAFLCNFRLLHPSFFGIVSMYNMTHLREEFTFEETISISDNSRCLRWTCVLHCKFTRFSDTSPCNGLPRACLTFCFWFGFERITTTTKPLRSSAGIASMRKPASREIISDSVEMCDTQACFLHIQLIGTNVWRRNSYNVPPEVDFESSRSPAKSESWNSPIGIVMLYFPRNNVVCTHSRNECKWSKRARRLSQALVHFVIARASLLTDHRIPGLPMRGKYTHFRTIWEHTSDNPPTDFISSSLDWWSWVVLLANSQ